MLAVAPFLPRGLPRVLAWRRMRFAFFAALPFGLLVGIDSPTPTRVWLLRCLIVALLAVLAFGVAEQWPARLPGSLARWVLQLLAVVAAMPPGALLAYWITTGELRFWHDHSRLTGMFELCFAGLLFGPWMALAAMVRQREALARHQALSFQLERSELERQAADARLRLLQRQVQPHFLFNTLANVRALVRAGSPRAPEVLDSLIAYLRASVPRLDEPTPRLGQELDLVRAYLELMHMRMPDRLQFALHADPGAAELLCPPMTLLTLVENAVRHGIDPSEEGGRIEVGVNVREGRCIVRVVDTGVGLAAVSDSGGDGTGLRTLRERLQLAFGGDARLSLTALMPQGVCAELEFPARRGAA
jgi:signal transduction histidine kinase